MTTYYKGNNIGLNYDAAAGTWSFTNTPQDFIDPNAFSTPDPKFPTAPTTSTTPTEPEQDPCPAGYIYDNSLKQCVPDPNYQNPFAQQEQQNTTEAEKEQAEKDKNAFIEFNSETETGRKDMYNHALTKGYIDKDGNVLGPPQAPLLPMGLTAVAQFGINRQYNRWLTEMGKYDASMKAQGLPTGFAQAIGFAKILPRFYETSSKIQMRGRDVDAKLTTPSSSNANNNNTSFGEQVDIEQEFTDTNNQNNNQQQQEFVQQSSQNTQDSYEQASGVNQNNNNNSSSTEQSSNQGPAGGPPPPSSAAEAFKRYGRF